MENPQNNIMNSLIPGTKITIDFSGIHHSASVTSLEGSLLVAYVNNTPNTYIIDTNRGVVFDHLGQEGRIILNSRTFQQMLTDPSVTNEELDDRVWLAVTGVVPECRCHRCTLSNIILLREAVRNPPPGGGHNIIMMCVYIMQSMIPRMLQHIAENIEDLAQLIQGEPDGPLSQVLRASMQDGPKRHAAKEEVVSSLSSFVQPYDSCTHTCDTCTICMEKFEDIETETKKPALVITCPGCDNSFCAGKQKSEVVEKDEESCLGFYRLMGDDNRCPICRLEVKEWVDVSSKKFPEKETKEEEEEVQLIEINQEIQTFPYTDSDNGRNRNRKHKFPPTKLKYPYTVHKYRKTSPILRHKRQRYGR